MLVIVATYGFEDVLLSGPRMADLLGITRANGLLALKALESTGLVRREGRMFQVWMNVLLNPMWQNYDRYDPDRDRKRTAHHSEWVTQREVHLYGESLEDREARRDESQKIMADFLEPVAEVVVSTIMSDEKRSEMWSRLKAAQHRRPG